MGRSRKAVDAAVLATLERIQRLLERDVGRTIGGDRMLGKFRDQRRRRIRQRLVEAAPAVVGGFEPGALKPARRVRDRAPRLFPHDVGRLVAWPKNTVCIYSCHCGSGNRSMRHSSGNSRVQTSATSSVAPPPTTTAGIDADPCRGQARLELAEFVRCADEDRVHCADAATDRIGGFQLHEQVTDEDADHVARAEHGQRDERQPEAGREPEDERGDAEDDDAAEHPVTDASRDGIGAQYEAGQARRPRPARRATSRGRSAPRAARRRHTPATRPSRRRTARRTGRARSRRARAVRRRTKRMPSSSASRLSGATLAAALLSPPRRSVASITSESRAAPRRLRTRSWRRPGTASRRAPGPRSSRPATAMN